MPTHTRTLQGTQVQKTQMPTATLIRHALSSQPPTPPKKKKKKGREKRGRQIHQHEFHLIILMSKDFVRVWSPFLSTCWTRSFGFLWTPFLNFSGRSQGGISTSSASILTFFQELHQRVWVLHGPKVDQGLRNPVDTSCQNSDTIKKKKERPTHISVCSNSDHQNLKQCTKYCME